MRYDYKGYSIILGDYVWYAYKNGRLVAVADTDGELEEMLDNRSQI